MEGEDMRDFEDGGGDGGEGEEEEEEGREGGGLSSDVEVDDASSEVDRLDE